MQNLLDKPYAIRQFVVVERDEVIEAKRKAEEKLSCEKDSKKEDLDSKKISTLVESIIRGGFGSIVPTIAATAILVDLVVKAIEKQKELSQKINVNYLSFSESCELRFPIGHPRENQVYVGHPTLLGVYYPMNEFHKKVFEHKFAELNMLLMNLGAKKVEVKYVSGWDFETLNQLEAPVKGKGKVRFKNLKNRKIIYEANYADNNSLKLPEKMAWYHFEPTWCLCYSNSTPI